MTEKPKSLVHDYYGLFKEILGLRKFFRFVAPLILLLVISCISQKNKIYDSRIQEKEILTPAPQKSPRINGAKVYGVRPGKKILYRIPCQGERPIKFKAEGLPAGIHLNEEKGIIEGISPIEKGEYQITFVSENKYGKDSRQFKLVVGDKIALTPPTGWNSWGGHMVHVTDEIIRKAADVFENRGLADVGFQYIGIDDCWMKTSPEMYASRSENIIKKHASFNYDGIVGDIRDEEGNIIPNKNFPDMKALTDYVHSFGLKAGLYSTPGPATCQNFAGSYEHEKQDAEQYAKWGFDLLKYDQCSGGKILKKLKEENTGFQDKDFWKPMAEYLLQQDHDILYNLCQYGQEEPWLWAPDLNIQSWRIGGDLNHNVNTYFDQAFRIAKELREFSKPGQWNDPDFMYIHRIKDVKKMGEPSEEIPLNTNQRYQYVTLWSIISAPFFFSSDIQEIDDFTIGLLSNADVFNINQDELGHVAKIIRDNENETIMIKNLANGTKVLALFNRNASEEITINANWAELDLQGRQKVFDVWRQKVAGSKRDEISVKLSPNGVGLFILSKQ